MTYFVGDDISLTPESNFMELGWSLCDPKLTNSGLPKITRHSNTCIKPSESGTDVFTLHRTKIK
ncbi:hypothetical protein HanIR_Chr12g0586391 [Helianthus annuus]|nr:hypothetical protein HanIR_Chr12g0586391 [Helianthus annuus]